MRAEEIATRPLVLEVRSAGAGRRALSRELELRAGELAVWECGEEEPAGWLGDVAMGLEEAGGVEVRFLGRRWEEMTSGEAEQYRRRVGRVYAAEEGATWVQNLDLDENLHLAQCFDPGQRRREVAERAVEVGRRFGLEEPPRMRPSVAGRRILQLAQWVRAFLAKELALLILEQPLRGVEEADGARLRANVAEARAGGVAVVWVGRGWAEGEGVMGSKAEETGREEG